jgi:hypothetical protein
MFLLGDAVLCVIRHHARVILHAVVVRGELRCDTVGQISRDVVELAGLQITSCDVRDEDGRGVLDQHGVRRNERRARVSELACEVEGTGMQVVPWSISATSQAVSPR